MSLAFYARSVAIALDALASAPLGLVSVAAARFALAEWERACLRAVGADRRTVLPPWPMWLGARQDPGRIAVALSGGEVRELGALAEECRRWAAECERRMAA